MLTKSSANIVSITATFLLFISSRTMRPPAEAVALYRDARTARGESTAAYCLRLHERGHDVFVEHIHPLETREIVGGGDDGMDDAPASVDSPRLAQAHRFAQTFSIPHNGVADGSTGKASSAWVTHRGSSLPIVRDAPSARGGPLEPGLAPSAGPRQWSRARSSPL